MWRPENDILEQVRRMAGARRRRRRIAMAGVASGTVAALVVILVAVAASQNSPRHPLRVAASPGASNTTAPTATEAPTTSTTAAPASPPTTAHAAVPTARSPVPGTTPAPTTSTTIPFCRDSDYQYSVTTDHPSYPQGATVNFTLTETNRSGHPCETASSGGGTPGPCSSSDLAIVDAAGNPVYDRQGQSGVLNCPMEPYSVLAPGASITNTFAWDQSSCPTTGYSSSCTSGSPKVPPGSYAGQTYWNHDGYRGPDVNFQIT